MEKERVRERTREREGGREREDESRTDEERTREVKNARNERMQLLMHVNITRTRFRWRKISELCYQM